MRLIIDKGTIDEGVTHTQLWVSRLTCKVCDGRIKRGHGVGVHWTLQTPGPPFTEGGSALFCYDCFMNHMLKVVRQHVEAGEVVLTGQVRVDSVGAAGPNGSPGPA